MGPAAPYVDRPEYMYAQECANDIADLLAPQVCGSCVALLLARSKLPRTGCGLQRARAAARHRRARHPRTPPTLLLGTVHQ